MEKMFSTGMAEWVFYACSVAIWRFSGLTLRLPIYKGKDMFVEA
jgi:hypothetical protein